MLSSNRHLLSGLLAASDDDTRQARHHLNVFPGDFQLQTASAPQSPLMAPLGMSPYPPTATPNVTPNATPTATPTVTPNMTPALTPALTPVAGPSTAPDVWMTRTGNGGTAALLHLAGSKVAAAATKPCILPEVVLDVGEYHHLDEHAEDDGPDDDARLTGYLKESTVQEEDSVSVSGSVETETETDSLERDDRDLPRMSIDQHQHGSNGRRVSCCLKELS